MFVGPKQEVFGLLMQGGYLHNGLIPSMVAECK